jgi:hypothetical protein
VTKTYFGSGKNQITHAVSRDTNHANAFVAAGDEKYWSQFDHCGGEVHDVFIVISEGSDGEQVARTVYAASQDDARQAHQANYFDEAIVAVTNETITGSDI